ncbi:MAG: Gx transporter family protein [Candidatus Omnitrophota bacterium]|nr:Gx transporter family protein [Candidatus Omnitrophota bacterium]
MKENQITDNNIYKVALLVSLACVLQIAESLIPHPVPGLRLGLANIITLVALVNLGFGYSLEITVLRTVLSSFIMGTFMSPGFILSFAAGVMSTLTMGFLYWLTRTTKQRLFSIVGISVAGALVHNIVQLGLAYLILVKHAGIFIFLPWLSIGAVFIGWFTGAVSSRICLKLKETEDCRVAPKVRREYQGLKLNHYVAGNSVIHQILPEIKIAGVIMLSLAVLFFNSLWFYAVLFVFFAAAAISTTSFQYLFSSARRCSSLIFVSFLFPVFFNSGKHVVSHFAYFNITSEGLNTGIIFALRLVCLIWASSLLARTTSPEDLGRGLSRILSPLKPLGISGKRVAAILSLSWTAIPIFWEIARASIRELDLKKTKDPRNLITFMSDIIVNLYLETSELTDLWKGFYPGKPVLLGKEGSENLASS